MNDVDVLWYGIDRTDREIALRAEEPSRKLRDLEHVTSIVVTHQIRDAFYVANHEAVRTDGGLEIRESGSEGREHARFMVLHEGRIYFEGTASELLAQEDAYLREFLFMTLPPW